jgi:hypothetical protein
MICDRATARLRTRLRSPRVYNRLISRLQCRWVISILLVAVIARALIPAGFMPAGGFTYQICPDGFPAQLLHDEHAAHHAHHVNHANGAIPGEDQHGSHEHASRAEHCVFAAAASAGPAPQNTLVLTAVATEAAAQLYFSPAPATLTRYRAQQPRGPPPLS